MLIEYIPCYTSLIIHNMSGHSETWGVTNIQRKGLPKILHELLSWDGIAMQDFQKQE